MSRRGETNWLIVILAVIVGIILLPVLLKLSVGLLVLFFTAIMSMFSGALAGRLLRGEGYGFWGDVALGFVGGIIGALLFSVIGLGWILAIPIIGPIFVGAVGAVVFVLLVRLIFKSDFAR
jgi:uncharacterized membrane protein YeaQ/YmgE (transglycosylase-associated protein family)